MLTRIMGQTVIDRTGLTGADDVDFEWSPESTYETPVDAEPSSRPSIFAFIQQFGLKLEATKGTVDIFVIDHVEKPSDN